MKKKIFAVTCILLMLSFILPTCNSQGVVKDAAAFSTITMAHVVINGNGTTRFLGSISLPGFGRTLGMIIKLNADGHVEINKLFDRLNVTKLDGSRIILLIWFIGFYYHENGINLNGVALIAVW